MLIGFKLSNYGDTLKLLIPNYYWKIVSGQVLFRQILDYIFFFKNITNHLGMVISQKMHRNRMGNRVSKSISLILNFFFFNKMENRKRFNNEFVKEQRADGSWLFKNNLRCALLVFERNYITKILSKRSLTTQTFCYNHLNNNLFDSKLNWFITGIIDAEGAFMIKIRKLTSLRAGWAIEPTFEISLHLKDLDLLNLIRNYFGNISNIRIIENKKICVFSVRSLIDIVSKILPHFDNYSLITQKQADYLLFKKVILMMQNKEHLTKEGIKNIINIRASMNLGLTSVLIDAFPNNVPIQRPVVNDSRIPDPKWLAGFASGEGCFFISIIYNKYKTRTYVQLKFSISQHKRDLKLIESFISYFNSGYVIEDRGSVYFYVVKFSDIYEKIIPYFKDNKILGEKSKDFNDWSEAAEIMKQSKHLTKDGLTKIIKIKQGMNLNRKNKDAKAKCCNLNKK